MDLFDDDDDDNSNYDDNNNNNNNFISVQFCSVHFVVYVRLT